MITIHHRHKIVLLTSSFQYPARRLLFARARLFLDRIELTGWHFGEKYQSQIPFEDLEQIEWKVGETAGPNALFHMADGTTYALHLNQVKLWKHTLEERLRWSKPGLFRLSPSQATRDMPLHELVNYTSGLG